MTGEIVLDPAGLTSFADRLQDAVGLWQQQAAVLASLTAPQVTASEAAAEVATALTGAVQAAGVRLQACIRAGSALAAGARAAVAEYESVGAESTAYFQSLLASFADAERELPADLEPRERPRPVRGAV